jgi:hypothetical protein
LKRDGSWSEPVGITHVRIAAATRIAVGKGPFSCTKNGEIAFANKSRLTALNRLVKELDGGKVGNVYRVRNGKGVIIFSVREVAVKPAIDPIRVAMVKWCRWGIPNQGAIHYSQARPISQYNPGRLPMTLDCSGSTITFARWAGAPDPSGNGFNGSGSTDTLLAHAKATGKEIERRELKFGDMALWAIGTDGKHVAVVIETGDDPLLASHGQEAGPIAIRLSAEDRYHSSETVHYLSLL